jgi:hypothetical protein
MTMMHITLSCYIEAVGMVYTEGIWKEIQPQQSQHLEVLGLSSMGRVNFLRVRVFCSCSNLSELEQDTPEPVQ